MRAMTRRRFENKVVVVTGAASGIGRATALAFSREGARLHLVDCSADPLQDVAGELRARGGQATTHVVDCSDAAAMEALAERVLAAEPSGVDVLHNNAGVMTAAAFERIPLSEWERVMGVNFWGVLHGVRAFLPSMIARRRGHIVNTASMAGLAATPHTAPYVASKHAVVGLTQSLAMELGTHDIGVTLLCPGATRTAIMRSGKMDLPGNAGPMLQRALERWAPRPEGIAEKVLDAVWHRRPLVASGMDMVPLWWLQRLAPGLYLRLNRLTTAAIVRLSERGATR